MTTASWLAADLACSLVCAVLYVAAGTCAAAGRTRAALGSLVGALLAGGARTVCVVQLARAGNWFVEEKLLVGLPLLVAGSVVAAGVAGPRLLAATRRQQWGPDAASVVALLFGAYSVIAGTALTVVAAYPMTWGKAAVPVGAVALASVLTHRVVAAALSGIARPGQPSAGVVEEPVTMPARSVHAALSRRTIVRLSGGAALGAVAPVVAIRPSSAVGVFAATGSAPVPLARQGGPMTSVASLRGDTTPACGGKVHRHQLTARQATVQLGGTGRTTEVWSYEGQVPGPAITATEGDLLEVLLDNHDVPDGVTIHWHGYDVPCGEDGAPGTTQEAVRPGQQFTYRFRTDQVGTYWYHTHHASHVGVRKGLFGTLVVHPLHAPLDEPVGEGAGGKSVDLVVPIHTLGGVLLVAGEEALSDRAVPVGTPVRARLINADSTTHRITVVGTTFRVVAVDGRDVNEAGYLTDVGLRLPAGGRRDVTFEMPASPVHILVDDDPSRGLRLVASDQTPAESGAPGTNAWPVLDLLRYGTPAPLGFDPRRPDRRYTLVLDRGLVLAGGRPSFAHTVNGRGHPSIPDQAVAEGELVGLTLVNRSFETHPWHLHGHAVLVVSRNGMPCSGSPLWVDSLDVEPGDVWEVVFRADNPGVWMNHCHNLPHAHDGMMLRLAYAGVESPFGSDHAHEGH